MKSVLNIHWKDWCWSWNSNALATWCEELTHLKRPWCWERLRGVGEGDNRGWNGWMASPTLWTWVWVNSGRWWWTRRPGVLQSMGSQRVGHDWATELNWTELNCSLPGSSVMGFPRQEYWSRLPFPPPGDLPNPGKEPMSPALAGRFFTSWATREAHAIH